MFSTVVVGATALALTAQASASKLSPIDTFYPPMLNNGTSYITNTCLGTYGGVYQSPTRDANTTLAYGTYNYCQMPHPRSSEYKLPGPIANGSVSGKIVFLEYLQRHQRRTPYNIFPNGESVPFDCQNIEPMLYAAPVDGVAPMAVYADTYTSQTNPFVKGYIPGTCQYPQLTIGGYLDGVQHGRDLWSVYGEKLGLIPATPDGDAKEEVSFRSTESPLTQQSAGGVLRGVWPSHVGALPLKQQANSVDTVNNGYSCSKRGSVLSAIESTDAWNAHLTATEKLRSDLGSLLGAESSDWQNTFDHFADNFQARRCNGYSLPCSRTDPSKCVSEQQADEVFRAGDWMWNYWYRANDQVKLYIQLVEGLFIGEILDHVRGVVNGTSTLKYSHVFVHDGDIGPVLGALGIQQLRWPAMGSNIAIELWKVDHDGSFYARVLYSGQPVRTIHGTLDWIPVQTLVDILSPYVPDDILSLCSA